LPERRASAPRRRPWSPSRPPASPAGRSPSRRAPRRAKRAWFSRVVPFAGCCDARKRTPKSFQPLDVGADALCISAKVAAADARLRADVHSAEIRAPGIRGAHADRNVVLEAEPLGAVDRLDRAGRGVAPDDF